MLAVMGDLSYIKPPFLGDTEREMAWACFNFENIEPTSLCYFYIAQTTDTSKCVENLQNAVCQIYTKLKNPPSLIIITGDFILRTLPWKTTIPHTMHKNNTQHCWNFLVNLT